MEDDGDAVFVVGDAKTVGAIAVDAERLLRQHAALVDSVHVGQEQDAGRTTALKTSDHRVGELLRQALRSADPSVPCRSSWRRWLP